MSSQLILKHTATGRETEVHQFQGLYVKSVDDKGETHYTEVDYYPFDSYDYANSEDGVVLPDNTVGIIVKR